MLAGIIKADWIQLPVEGYLEAFPGGHFRGVQNPVM